MKNYLILVELEYNINDEYIRCVGDVLFKTIKADSELEALKTAQDLVVIDSYFQDGRIESFRIHEIK